MTPTPKQNPFINEHNRLRSFWRALVYIAFTYVALFIGAVALYLAVRVTLGEARAGNFFAGLGGFVAQASLTFGATLLIGWACGRVLEKLPLRALGWAAHAGWLRDFALGTGLGVATLLLATAVGALGGAQWQLQFAAAPGSVWKTVAFSALGFVWFAAAEEIAFRGYALQTLTRAGYAWAGIFLTSLPFALAHVGNPNVAPFFTILNTTLAGVWLGVAYWKTRSLWFPLGLHWAWNWAMGALVGLPVSGITEVTPAPLFQTTLNGAKWLTGGAYGIEGGLACTLAIAVSTLFVWRTRVVKASDEMLAFDEVMNDE
jgi:hypothetical protein